jgi:sulfonate transport system permease protein
LPVAILLAWELVLRSGAVDAYQLPAPAAVANELFRQVSSGELAHHLGVSIKRVASGFALGASVATLLGAFSGYSKVWRETLDPTFQALRSLPAIAWVPLFVLWLGIGEAPKIALVALGAFFPIYLNLMTGMAGVDRKLAEVGQVNRLTGMRLVLRIHLPYSLPAYMVGLRAGLGLAWMFVVAAELMGASEGIGFLLLDGEQTGRPDRVIVAMVVFALIGKFSDFLLVLLSGRVLRWQDTVKDS